MSKKICPACGYVDNNGAGYCRECGAKMSEYDSGENSQGGQFSSYQENVSSSSGQPVGSNGQSGQFSSYQESTGGSSYQSSAGGGTEQSGQYNNYQDYTSNVSYQPQNFEPEKSTNGLQIAGLVCGILAICSCCCYGVPAVILGIAGIICASMGNKNGKSGVGTGGFVCSIIGLILGIVATIYYVMVFSQMSQMDYDQLRELMDMFQ